MSESDQSPPPEIVRVKTQFWVGRISEHRETIRTSKNPDGSVKSEYGEPYWSVYLSGADVSLRFEERPPFVVGFPITLILEQTLPK